MKQKIVCFILAIMMIATLGVTAFADETPNYASMSNKSLSEITGLSIKELNDTREMYGDEFNDAISNYIKHIVHIDYEERARQPIIVEDYETGTRQVLQNRNFCEGWELLSARFKRGQIIITDEGDKWGFDHGHAAILYSTTETIEHRGYSDRVSGKYDVTWWGEYYTAIKTLKYSDQLVMNSAAIYAFNNLQNRQYSPIAPRRASVVNCATLVWQAYDSTGVNVVDSTTGTVLPKYYDTSSKLTPVYSIGWDNVHWS